MKRKYYSPIGSYLTTEQIRGYWSIKFDPNLSDDEKKVQREKFSQEYKTKLEK